MKNCDNGNGLYGSDLQACKVFPDRCFPRSSFIEGALILAPLQKVAKQLPTVASSPQKINACAMADRILIRYYDETLLVKHLPSLPVRMRAGGPGARRGFFSGVNLFTAHITPEETADLSIIPPSSALSACASFSSSA